ncbi:hypothetical protein ABEW33_27325 [Priestia megaterium]
MLNQLTALIDCVNAVIELVKNIIELSQNDALTALSGAVFFSSLFFIFNFNFNFNINFNMNEGKKEEGNTEETKDTIG